MLHLFSSVAVYYFSQAELTMLVLLRRLRFFAFMAAIARTFMVFFALIRTLLSTVVSFRHFLEYAVSYIAFQVSSPTSLSITQLTAAAYNAMNGRLHYR